MEERINPLHNSDVTMYVYKSRLIKEETNGRNKKKVGFHKKRVNDCGLSCRKTWTIKKGRVHRAWVKEGRYLLG